MCRSPKAARMSDPHARVVTLAASQGNVVSRRQAYAAGMTRSQLRAQLAAGRWRRTGGQTVSTTNGDLSRLGLWWCAVLEVGPRAALDGVSALLTAGLRAFDEHHVHVSSPKSSRPLHPAGVVVHESRRFREADVLTFDVRRIRPPVAAVHAALWAQSDRQAVLILVMTVQQRVATARAMSGALSRVRRHRRRALLTATMLDIGGGSHSLGELDVLRGLRRRGLPEPSRQALRELSGGRAYLDIEWEDWKLVLEVDGSQHDAADHRLADTLRDLEVTAGGRTVLRLPLLAWRLDEEAVLDRVTAVFRSRGWFAAA